MTVTLQKFQSFSLLVSASAFREYAIQRIMAVLCVNCRGHTLRIVLAKFHCPKFGTDLRLVDAELVARRAPVLWRRNLSSIMTKRLELFVNQSGLVSTRLRSLQFENQSRWTKIDYSYSYKFILKMSVSYNCNSERFEWYIQLNQWTLATFPLTWLYLLKRTSSRTCLGIKDDQN